MSEFKAEMTEAMDAILELAKERMPELAELYRLYYLELIKAGFTEEQAMEITKNYSLKS